MIVDWVKRSEIQQKIDNVGFISSTQPTLGLVFMVHDTKELGNTPMYAKCISVFIH